MSEPSDSTFPGHPDPVVTANVYAAGRLDELILQGIVPFRASLRAVDPAAYVWLMRYSKRGQHLKVRVHAEPGRAQEIRAALRAAVEPVLEALSPLADDESRRTRPKAIPIDEDDRGEEDLPDRTLRFTAYGVSHVCLGGSPFLELAPYRARMARCLAAACDRVLEAVEARGEALPEGVRRRVLLEGLIEGLRSLGLAGADAAEYLAYHRDWVVRFPLMKSANGREAAREILDRFHRQSAKMTATIEALGEMLGAPPATETEIEASGPSSPWRAALEALWDYLEPMRDDPEFRIDPFAPVATYAPMFKVFHGLANQVGLNPLQEGIGHHLLLMAVAEHPERYAEIALTPFDA